MYNYYFDNLLKAKKLETKSILTDEKNIKDLHYSKLLKMLSLHYHELIGNIKEHEGDK